jgi:hypothetical protein
MCNDLADPIARDKVNLDIFWLKDDSLDDPQARILAEQSRSGRERRLAKTNPSQKT